MSTQGHLLDVGAAPPRPAPASGDVITVRVPGEPCAQGRPRAFKTPRGFIRTYDPAKSRNWKAMAADCIGVERGGADLDITFPAGPIEVEILAVFSCPRGDWRKVPVPRRRHSKARGDVDNLAKGCLDAATAAGLWTDDAQVARLVVEKWIAAQDEAAFVEIRVRPLA